MFCCLSLPGLLDEKEFYSFKLQDMDDASLSLH